MTAITPYTASQGYGWANPQGITSSYQTWVKNPLLCAYQSAQDATWVVNLPNGAYNVIPTLGDPVQSHDTISVWLQGQQVASGLSTPRGQVIQPTFPVQVTNGQLTMRLSGVGGNDPSFSLDALDIVPSQITIDSNWLQQHGPGPYLLDQANTTYTLATDVTVPGTAFVVGAANITLDLNGHTVIYDNTAPILVNNGGFEMGSGRNVPGWDLSGAPSATLAPNTSYLYGSQVLRLNHFSTAQHLFSDPIAIPRAGHTYAATITPAHATDWNTTFRLSVIDALTGQVLGSGQSANPLRGFSAVARFTPTTTDPVRLQIDVTPAAGVNETLDLDYASVTPADDYGILASRQWSGQVPGYANLAPAQQSTYRQAANFTVRNGSLIQGQGHGYASDPLFCEQLPGLTVTNVQTMASGMDTLSLDANYTSGSVTVRGSTFKENIDNISNRMSNYATLELNHVNGPIVIDGNHLFGSPQMGIMLSYNNPQYAVVVSNNEISQNAVVTNGYGIAVAALQHFEIANNVITPVNGRGIDIDGYSKTPIADGQIHGNYVSVQEHLNREYYTRTEARALRLRNDVDGMGPQHDLRIYNNTFIATTGKPGQAQEAYGVRISYVNPGGEMNDANIVLENNVIKAIVTTTDPSYKAKALLVDGVAPGIHLVVRDNVLESNDTSLALGGSDGGDVTDVLFLSNTLRKSASGSARPYTGILAGYWIRQIHNVALIDTRADQGATAAIVWSGSGAKDVSVGWLLNVTVRDSQANPVAGAAVTIFDQTGNPVSTGTTDGNGQIGDIPLIAAVYRQTGTSPNQITSTISGPFTVQATWGQRSAQLTFTLTGNLEATLTLS